MKPENKFDWINVLAADTTLAESYKFVGTIIAIKSVLTRGDMVFHIRQTSVATNCGTSLRTVKRAYAALKDHGYIELVDNRRRGPRANADKYRLTLPELSANLAPHSEEELGANGGTVRCHSGTSYVPNLSELGATPNAETSGNDTLKVFKKVIEKGLERGGCAGAAEAASLSASFIPDEEQIFDAEIVDDAPQDLEPNQYCKAHIPFGSDSPCGPCKIARLAHEAWTERNHGSAWMRLAEMANLGPTPEEQRLEEEQRRLEAIANCDQCDDNGDKHTTNYKGRVYTDRCSHKTSMERTS